MDQFVYRPLIGAARQDHLTTCRCRSASQGAVERASTLSRRTKPNRWWSCSAERRCRESPRTGPSPPRAPVPCSGSARARASAASRRRPSWPRVSRRVRAAAPRSGRGSIASQVGVPLSADRFAAGGRHPPGESVVALPGGGIRLLASPSSGRRPHAVDHVDRAQAGAPEQGRRVVLVKSGRDEPRAPRAAAPARPRRSPSRTRVRARRRGRAGRPGSARDWDRSTYPSSALLDRERPDHQVQARRGRERRRRDRRARAARERRTVSLRNVIEREGPGRLGPARRRARRPAADGA